MIPNLEDQRRPIRDRRYNGVCQDYKTDLQKWTISLKTNINELSQGDLKIFVTGALTFLLQFTENI